MIKSTYHNSTSQQRYLCQQSYWWDESRGFCLVVDVQHDTTVNTEDKRAEGIVQVCLALIQLRPETETDDVMTFLKFNPRKYF